MYFVSCPFVLSCLIASARVSKFVKRTFAWASIDSGGSLGLDNARRNIISFGTNNKSKQKQENSA